MWSQNCASKTLLENVFAFFTFKSRHVVSLLFLTDARRGLKAFSNLNDVYPKFT
jgi:hypothetical protein